MPLRISSHSRRAGFVLPLTLVAFLGFTVLGMAIFTLATSSSRFSNLGYQKIRATAAAEAGLHILFAQNAAALDAATTLPTTTMGTLTSSIAGASSTDGSYAASVTGSTIVSGVTTYSLLSTGTAPNGTTQSIIHAIFTSQPVPGGNWHWPNGSIVSNGPVKFGNSHTTTQDSSGTNSATVYANGSVTLGNNASVSGAVVTASTFSGNASSVPGGVTTGVTTPFPTAAQTTAWKAAWLAAAKRGTQYASCPAGGTTITAPAYINGDLTNNLTIQPTSGTNSVVYVNGNISGDIYVSTDGVPLDGVTIVCTGTFTSQNLREANEPYTATVVTYGTANLDFSNSTRNDIEGVIDAVNAGFTLKNPGWTFNGTIIAGGAAGVDFGTGGGNASVTYPGNNLDSASNRFTFAPVISTITNWIQTR